MAENFSYPVGSLSSFKELERSETDLDNLSRLLESEFKRDFMVACETGTRASYALIYQIDSESKGQEFAEWYKQNHGLDEKFAAVATDALISIGNDAGLRKTNSIDIVVRGAHGYQAYRAQSDNPPESEDLAKEYLRHVKADESIPLDCIERYDLNDAISIL